MSPLLPREPFPWTSVHGAQWCAAASPARRLALPYALPAAALLAALLALAWHGPIAQPLHYHDFADQRGAFGLPHAADVLSNAGFAVVGVLGLGRVLRAGWSPALRGGRDGWALFFGALVLTALGSAAYHLAPDNARLVWDRVPIALACAGLLAATWRETIGAPRWVTPLLAAAALASVAAWRLGDLNGAGDLRPYLLLQGLPLAIVPLLQWQHAAPMRERVAVAGAMGFYVLAKFAEGADQPIFAALGVMSGHTLKHLLATLAAALLAAAVCGRGERGWRRHRAGTC